VKIAPDSSRVVWVFGTNLDHQLYSAPLDGSSAKVQLNDPLAPSLIVSGEPYVQISPDSTRVVFVTGETNFLALPRKLLSARIEGGEAPVRLTPPLTPGQGIPQGYFTPFALSPDSNHVVFAADTENIGVNELYWGPLDGSAEPTRLTSGLVYPGVKTFAWGEPTLALTADSRHVVYVATQRPEVNELFGTRLTTDPFRRHLAPTGGERP
jgi:Tol biopolymer transport system component